MLELQSKWETQRWIKCRHSQPPSSCPGTETGAGYNRYICSNTNPVFLTVNSQNGKSSPFTNTRHLSNAVEEQITELSGSIKESAKTTLLWMTALTKKITLTAFICEVKQSEVTEELHKAHSRNKLSAFSSSLITVGTWTDPWRKWRITGNSLSKFHYLNKYITYIYITLYIWRLVR